MNITKDDVSKALDSFEQAFEEKVSKASDKGLDQAEGADLGNPVKEKMSDAAKSAKKAEGEMAVEGDKKPAPFMKKGDEEMGEEGEDESEEQAPPTMKAKKSVKKSFDADMPEEIQTKIDVSEFLKSLVDHTGECIEDLSKSLDETEERLAKSHGQLVGAIEDVQKSQAKIGVVLKAICQRIGIIENTPAQVRKSEVVAKSGAADREFSSGLAQDAGEEPMFKSLSQNPVIAKSQMSNALCDLVKKGEASDLDVIGFESSGHIRPELVSKLKTVLN